MSDEIWKDIPGFEGYYKVSSFGNIRSIYRKLRVADTRGYYHVGLSKDNIVRNYRVHVLVAITFIGPRPEGLVLNHLDRDTHNNRLENLEYTTQSENVRNSVVARTHKESRKTHCPSGHEYDEENTYIFNSVTGTTRKCRTCARLWMRGYGKKKIG